MSIFHDIEQNTPEWQALRSKKFTASMFSDLFMGKSTLGYKKAILKVVYERLTDESPETFSNFWTDRGHELEPEAIEYYERQTFTKVRPGGFFELNEWVGCSPDGLVGSDGLLECKSPAWSTMMGALMGDKKVIEEYDTQVQGQLMVTGRAWCDLLFYHPKLKPVIIRINADKEKHEAIEKELKTAIASAESILEKLTKFKK